MILIKYALGEKTSEKLIRMLKNTSMGRKLERTLKI
jgi:hypothetical protein